jgi:hypothetical protein
MLTTLHRMSPAICFELPFGTHGEALSLWTTEEMEPRPSGRREEWDIAASEARW